MFGTKKKIIPAQHTAAQIVPRIKHKNFLTAVASMNLKPGETPLTEPFVGDLIITYAYDTPEMFVMFAERELDRLALTRGQVRTKAIENLYKQLPPVKTNGKPPVLSLSVGNKLEACLLLVSGLWNGFAKQIPGKPVVAVPTRDILLVTSSESSKGLETIAEIGSEARQRDPVHSLSEPLLVWDQNGWQVFDGGPAAT